MSKEAQSFVLLLAMASPALAEGLHVGFATRVITPDVKAKPVYLAGFDENRVATDVHDPLYARCLAVSDGRTRLAVASVDLIGFFLDDTEKTRTLLRQKAADAELVVTSTHNHEGPDTMGMWGPSAAVSGKDPAYLEGLREKVAECAAEALSRLSPARLVLARTRTPGLVEDGRLPRVIDDELFVLEAVAGNGRTLGTLVNWSSHPEALGGKNTRITADYPHFLVKKMEAALGGTTVFVSGSIGGLMSALGVKVADASGRPVPEETFAHAQAIGERAADAALVALVSGTASSSSALEYRRARVSLPLRNGYFRLAYGVGIFDRPLVTEGKQDSRTGNFVFRGQPLALPLGEDLTTEIGYLRLGDAEVLLVPGEIYPELVIGGIQDPQDAGADYLGAPKEAPLKGLLSSEYRMVFGLANDEIGYIIPKSQWDQAPPWAYGREQTQYGEMNSVGPDVAPTLADAFARLLKP